MDPEQTFLRVHARLTGMLSQLLTPRIRFALEYLYLTVAVALFCILVVMHTNFVQQPGCSSEFTGVEFTEAQLVQIKIVSGDLWPVSTTRLLGLHTHGSSKEKSIITKVNGDEMIILTTKFWSNWIGAGARRGKLASRSWRGDKELLDPKTENTVVNSVVRDPPEENVIGAAEGSVLHPLTSKETVKAAVTHFISKWCARAFSFSRSAKNAVNSGWFLNGSTWKDILKIFGSIHAFRVKYMRPFIVHWVETRSKSFEPTYLYAVEKGYFLLSEGAKAQHGIRAINITISAQNPCFGNRWQQLLINTIVGYDTILMNSLLSSPSHGYFYNFQTKEFYDLSYGHETTAGPNRFGDYFVKKIGVLIISLLVFFTTTMSISFTLRETQLRMLKFTVQLQHHAQHGLPTFQLIFVHVIESLVFVPIMIGILFFLFEFYDNHMLAFCVLTLVWLCELFTMISVRTALSVQFFPRFFLLYFLVFHIYFFSYTYGFSYLAFAATAAFVQHLILYFWNHFEVPALHRFFRSRGPFQRQASVQITSSTIYASALHIARLNVRDVVLNGEGTALQENLVDQDLPSNGGIPGLSEPSGQDAQHSQVADPAAAVSPTVADQNTEQAGNPPDGANVVVNPLGSVFLWLLGGGASDGIVSFFSMFRDAREPGQYFVHNIPADADHPDTRTHSD